MLEHFVQDDEYIRQLRIKLGEELQEYLSAGNDRDALEELADLQELILTLAAVHGTGPDQLQAIRRKKASAGAFRTSCSSSKCMTEPVKIEIVTQNLLKNWCPEF